MIVKAARTVYSVAVERVMANEQQVRQNLQAKLDLIRRNQQMFG